MKKIALMILALSAATCFAQKDPEAKAILDKAAKQAAGYKSITAEFDCVYENLAEEKSENYNGTLLLKGNRFRIDVDKTITFCDGKTRWAYITESNEVTISPIEVSNDDAPEDKFMSDPMSLYTIYRSGFKYIMGDTEEIGGKTMQIIELAPENIKKPYFKIKYWFSPNNDLYQIKCFQKDGTRFTLTLTKFATNQKIDDTQLIFDAKKFPGVEVIDMRD
jgi:outer membrane lipoprotein-sorting protein